MTRFAVRTLALNPSIDMSSEAEQVAPERKVRTCCERIDPGGGGINVARVLQRLGSSVEALFMAGGATGRAFEDLVRRAGLEVRCVPIADDTRTSLTIHERSTGKEYRFVPEGPTVRSGELEACREAIAAGACDYFVASGSLPPGVPDDFYAWVCSTVSTQGGRFIIDTSGPELRCALAAGGIYLLKASKEEMDEAAAAAAIAAGRTELAALTLGSDGAILLSREGKCFLPTLNVDPVSTVGAGDSFLAGMTHGLAQGRGPLEAFRLAVAAGAAATLSPGTDLAYPKDIERLLPMIGEPQTRP